MSQSGGAFRITGSAVIGYAGHIPRGWDPQNPSHRRPKVERPQPALEHIKNTPRGQPIKHSVAAPPPPKPSVPFVVLEDLRTRLKKHGARGIHGIGRKFRILDKSGNRTLTPDEFAIGLQQLDIHCSNEEQKAIFAYFDKDGSGSTDYEEFLKHVR